MIKVLVWGMTENSGGVESVIMNYYRNIDRTKLQFDFLTNTPDIAFSQEILANGVKPWTAEEPNLYSLELSANGEKIIEQIGFREVKISGKVFKINGKHIKLKGVNRHDFNCETGATVSIENMVEDILFYKSKKKRKPFWGFP